MPHLSDPQSSSDYPELTLPPGGFVSKVPAPMLDGATPVDRWMMDEMSRNTQATEFCMRAAVEANALIRQTNGRLKVAEAQLADHEDDIAATKTDVGVIGVQFRRIKPLLDSLTMTRTLLRSKPFLIMLGICAAFLLGINRDTLIAFVVHLLS